MEKAKLDRLKYVFTAIETFKLLSKTNERRLRVCLLLVGIISLTCLSHRSVSAFTVTDADFDTNGVYELKYQTFTNTLVKNGVSASMDSTPLGELFLTNSGNTGRPAFEYFGSDAGVKYLQAPGTAGGFGVGTNSTWNTMASATMGWDFSSITGQIAQVELISSQFIFQFSPWGDESAGDSIFANIAIPTSFGSGPFTNIYTYTGNNPGNSSSAPGALGEWGRDITPNLTSAWLTNPNLLELEFGYTLLDTNIPGRHLELFRNPSGLAASGFMLKVTLVEDEENAPIPEPTTIALLGIGLVGLAGAEVRRRRKKKVLDNC